MDNKNSQLEVYTTKDGLVSFDVPLESETVWLTQKQMAELFEVTVPTINEHIKNIFRIKELEEHSVIRKFRITASDGKSYQTNHYNLDAIISVGYRVNSVKGVQFRQWATATLKDHLIQGVSVNSKKLYELEKLITEKIKADDNKFAEIRAALKFLMEKEDPFTTLL